MLAPGTYAEVEQQVGEVLSDTERLAAATSADVAPLPPPAEEPPQADGPFRRQRRTRTVKANSTPSASSVAHSRSLKRRASDGKPPELLCMNRLCVWGKHVRAPAVVYPLTRRDGRLYMPIHERLFWLRRACDKKMGSDALDRTARACRFQTAGHHSAGPSHEARPCRHCHRAPAGCLGAGQ